MKILGKSFLFCLVIALFSSCNLLNRKNERGLSSDGYGADDYKYNYVDQNYYPTTDRLRYFAAKGGYGLVPPLISDPLEFDISQFSSLDYNKMKSILFKVRPKTINDFLAELSRQENPILNNYTLVYDSGSIQDSSFSHPRAVVFSPDARLIFTFNGKSDQKGYEAIELVEMDPKKSSPEFREIIFKAESHVERPKFSDFDLEGSEIEYVNKDYIITKRNPKKCMGCHDLGQTGKMKYVWDNYFFWPGVYGSDDDFAYRPAKEGEFWANQRGGRLHSSQHRGFFVPDDKEDIELAKLLDFKAKKPTLDRYKHLGPFSKIHRPNASLSTAMAYRNIERIAKLINSDSKWRKLKYESLQAMLCSDPTYSVVDSQKIKQTTKSVLNSIMNHFYNAHRRHFSNLGHENVKHNSKEVYGGIYFDFLNDDEVSEILKSLPENILREFIPTAARSHNTSGKNLERSIKLRYLFDKYNFPHELGSTIHDASMFDMGILAEHPGSIENESLALAYARFLLRPSEADRALFFKIRDMATRGGFYPRTQNYDRENIICSEIKSTVERL